MTDLNVNMGSGLERRLCTYTDATVLSFGSSRRWPPQAQAFFHGEPCPYCLWEMHQVDFSIGRESREMLQVCKSCGWWAFWYGFTQIGIDGFVREEFLAEADVKHYAVDAIDAPLAELRKLLSTHPNFLAHLHPTRFEFLLQDVLKDAWAPCEVIHVGGTSDGGVDLKLIQSDKEPLLIQVKRRSDPSRLEGVQVVRELNGVLFREGTARGMIVTTRKGFSNNAHREVNAATGTTDRYEMHLVAFDDIVGMLQLPDPEPYEPWLGYTDLYNLVLSGSVNVVDLSPRGEENYLP